MGYIEENKKIKTIEELAREYNELMDLIGNVMKQIKKMNQEEKEEQDNVQVSLAEAAINAIKDLNDDETGLCCNNISCDELSCDEELETTIVCDYNDDVSINRTFNLDSGFVILSEEEYNKLKDQAEEAEEYKKLLSNGELTGCASSEDDIEEYETILNNLWDYTRELYSTLTDEYESLDNDDDSTIERLIALVLTELNKIVYYRNVDIDSIHRIANQHTSEFISAIIE